MQLYKDYGYTIYKQNKDNGKENGNYYDGLKGFRVALHQTDMEREKGPLLGAIWVSKLL